MHNGLAPLEEPKAIALSPDGKSLAKGPENPQALSLGFGHRRATVRIGIRG